VRFKNLIIVLICLAGLFFVFKSNYKKSICSNIHGAVLPHHLLAEFMIKDFFKQIEKQNPEILIIIGPNHANQGNAKVITDIQDWFWHGQHIKIDKTKVKVLLSLDLIGLDHQAVFNDQSIKTFLPFIIDLKPQPQIIPLVLKPNLSLNEINYLAEHLNKLSNERTLIVSSVDFSHYLKSADAHKNDQQTLTLIKNWNYEQLFKLEDDFLDSPASLITLMMIMKQNGYQPQLIQQSNSGELLNNSFIPTTSYFYILFK